MTAPTHVPGTTTADQAVPGTHHVAPLGGECAATGRPGTSTSTQTSPVGQLALRVEPEGTGSAGQRGSVVAVPPAVPLVIGLDVSLTSTGVAGVDWAQTLTTWSLPRKGATRAERWDRMRTARRQILPFVDGADLIVQESPAYSTGDMPGSQDLGWLWWAIYSRCASREIPWVEVGTSTLKVYATGNGRASKEDVVQHVQKRRHLVEFRGNDQADALTLAAMGLDHLGYPPVVMPQTHRRALDSVHWPTAATS